MSKPYKEVNPGDPILAADWNMVQSEIRQHILTHTHTGTDESGAKLDITTLASGADMAVRKLSASESFTVGVANQPLLSVNPAAPNQEGSYQVNVAGTLRAEQVRTSRLDGISMLAVGALAVNGNVGIGVTAAPTATLEVNGDAKFAGPVTLGQLIGDDSSDTLNIIGSGEAEVNRKIAMWAEGGVALRGDLAVSGATTLENGHLDIAQNPRTGAHPPAVKGLYVSGDFGAASDGVEFRHSNASQGIGFGHNTIYAAGTNANQDLNLLPKGTGTVGIATSSSLSFGSQTRQMVNLWGAGYGIGVQNSTHYFRTDKNFAWYKGGTHSDAELNAGANGTIQMVLKDGNVGIGAPDPASKLHVDNGRVDITTSAITGGGQNRFGGMRAWDEHSSYRRGQLVLSSSYSDLVIASSHVNNVHGSTLTFATANPTNVAEYRKWVINQGNWGTRKQFLDFGYADVNGRANPHDNINATDTVLTLDGVNKRLGLGAATPGATISFKNTDSSNAADGITWFNPTPTSYGIYRTAGAWSAPDFQQLRLSWITGIVLDPGAEYNKSYVEIQGGGLRVTTGNVGIGTTSPGTYKLNVQGGRTFLGDNVDVGNFQAADRYVTLKVQGGNKYRSGVRFWAWQENFGYSIEHDERDSALHFKGHNVNADGASLMVLKSGNLGIGTINPERKLHIKQPKAGQGIRLEETDGNGAATGRHLNIHYEGQGTVVFYHQTGAGQYMTQNGNWNLNSDRSLKENIEPLTGILDRVKRLKPVSFQWKSSKLENLGFIAQEVETIFPELVSSVALADRDVKGLPYAAFGVLAIAALQELATAYEERLNELSAQIAALSNAI